MKAGLAAMTGAVRGLARAGAVPAAPVQLHSVVEEECTGHGALQLLLDGARADACVLTEPHPDHLTVAQVGVLWFHVDLEGIPAHAARADRLGFNAIDAAQAVLASLRRLEERLNADPPPPFDAFAHPDQPQPGRDRRRRLAVDGGRDLHALVPARAVSGAGSGRPARAGRGGGGGGRRRRPGPLRRLRVRGRRRRRPPSRS